MTPEVERFDRHVNPAFVRLLGTLGYGRVFERAKGTRMWDREGREYLDMLAAFGATSLGHSPPRLIREMKSFLDDDAVNLMLTGPQIHAADLAADLAALCGGSLEVSMFSNSGGEALESAMKLARAATKRTRILYAHGGYHGNGLGPLSVMGSGRMRDVFEPLVPDCVEVPWDDAAAIDRALTEQKCAAVILEPLQIEAGVLIPKPNYLAEIHALCKRGGRALRAGRSADRARPHGPRSSRTSAKASSRTCSASAKRSAAGWCPSPQRSRHGTFGRAPTTRRRSSISTAPLIRATHSPAAPRGRSCASCKTTSSQNAQTRSARFFLARLRDRVSGHPLVRDVRGRGLVIGLELGAPQRTGIGKLLSGVVDVLSKKVFGQWLAVRLLEKNIVCQPASHQWNVLRLEPPLTVTEAEIERTIEAIGSILDEYKDLLPLVKDVGERLGKNALGGFKF